MNDLHIHIKNSDVTLGLGYSQLATELVGSSIHIEDLAKGKPAPEIRVLCDGKRVSYEEADKAVAALGPGWRLETPHELFNQVDYSHKNGNDAYSRDESIQPLPYWSNQVSPWSSEARVVVYFYLGYVSDHYRSFTALARAVRVSGQ